jgi:hypothetical protein
MWVGDGCRDEKTCQDIFSLYQILPSWLLLFEQPLPTLFVGLLSDSLTLLENPSTVQLDYRLDSALIHEQTFGHDTYEISHRLKGLRVAEAAEKLQQGSSIVVLRLIRHSALVPQPKEPARGEREAGLLTFTFSGGDKNA